MTLYSIKMRKSLLLKHFMFIQHRYGVYKSDNQVQDLKKDYSNFYQINTKEKRKIIYYGKSINNN